jgi:hypothetical protein
MGSIFKLNLTTGLHGVFTELFHGVLKEASSPAAFRLPPSALSTIAPSHRHTPKKTLEFFVRYELFSNHTCEKCRYENNRNQMTVNPFKF